LLRRRAIAGPPAAPKVRYYNRHAFGVTARRFGNHPRIAPVFFGFGGHKVPITPVGSPHRGPSTARPHHGPCRRDAAGISYISQHRPRAVPAAPEGSSP